MNIVFVGTHSSQPTGYAYVTRRLTSEIAAFGPRVHVYGLQGCGPSRHPAPRGGLSAIPEDGPPRFVSEVDAAAMESQAGVTEDGFYFSGLHHFVDARAADVVVVFNDPVIVGRFLDELARSERVRSGAARVFMYLDLVYESPFERHWATFSHPCVRGIMVMAECWRHELSKVPLSLPEVVVVPHAVETPIVSREHARDALGWTAPETTPTAVGRDALVFLNLNRNTLRKRLDLYAAAAARFLARNPDVDALFLAQSNQDECFDLHSVARRELASLGVPATTHEALLDRIRVNRTMLPDEAIVLLHNACDVAVNCAEGEGFGLVPVEAASVGKPVVVSAVGGALDTFGTRVPTAPPAAWVLAPKAEYWLDAARDGVGGRAQVVDVEDLARAFEAMADPETRLAYGKRGMERVRALPAWVEIAQTVLEFVQK